MSNHKGDGSTGSKSTSPDLRQQLIYVSPLPYESFSQRPHKFVHWFHDRTGGQVLWLNPYPTRLPKWTDFRQSRSLDRFESQAEPWLRVVPVKGLPIEPLPGGTAVNGGFWRATLALIAQFAQEGETMLVIGKPSAFANVLLEQLPSIKSVYDMMDNFGAFYDGLSARMIERNEARIVARAGTVLCSSTRLLQSTCPRRPDVRLVLNALDPDLPVSFVSKDQQAGSDGEKPRIFGYVGTIAQWFDWDLIQRLAAARPKDTIRIIGPLFNPPSFDLPPNVEVKPAVRHHEALKQMRQFDVALIPFKENPLTACVDPIKYYEYRAMGLPIMTTPFGEMRERQDEDGIFFVETDNLAPLAARALAYTMPADQQKRFIEDNTWSRRFDAAGLLSIRAP